MTRPFCGAIYDLDKTAGDPLVCIRELHLPQTSKHRAAGGFEWWSE